MKERLSGTIVNYILGQLKLTGEYIYWSALPESLIENFSPNHACRFLFTGLIES